MKNCISLSVSKYFSLLTAEEQAEDIKEYCRRLMETDAFNEQTLKDMTNCSARDRKDLFREYNRMRTTFSCGTMDTVLTSEQEYELATNGSTIVLVPNNSLNIIYFWARTRDLVCVKVVAHSTIPATEFVIRERVK